MFPLGRRSLKSCQFGKGKRHMLRLVCSQIISKKKRLSIPQRQKKPGRFVRLNYLKYQHIKNTYPLVNQHSRGKSPFSIGNTSSNGGFSIAMLDYRSVKLNCTNARTPRTPLKTPGGALLMTEERTEVVNFCVSSQPG